MITNDKLKINWDAANSTIVISNTENEITFTSDSNIIIGEGGYVTSNVSSQTHTDIMMTNLKYYFDVMVRNRLLNLTQIEKELAFKMLNDYAGVIDRITPNLSFPIINHIVNPTDDDINDPIVREFETWKASQS